MRISVNLPLSSVQRKLTCMSDVSCFMCVPTANDSRSSDKYEEQRRVWGGGLRGNKSTQMLRKRAKAAGQNISVAALGKL